MTVRSASDMAPTPKYMSGLINYFAGINLSIRSKILLSFFVIIFVMGLIDAILIVQALRFNREYEAIITNITAANSINGYIKPTIDAEMWRIVAGKTEFDQGKQYDIINNVNITTIFPYTFSSTKIPQPSTNSRDHSSPNHFSLSQPSPNPRDHS